MLWKVLLQEVSLRQMGLRAVQITSPKSKWVESRDKVQTLSPDQSFPVHRGWLSHELQMLPRLLKEVGDNLETFSNLVRMYHQGRKTTLHRIVLWASGHSGLLCKGGFQWWLRTWEKSSKITNVLVNNPDLNMWSLFYSEAMYQPMPKVICSKHESLAEQGWAKANGTREGRHSIFQRPDFYLSSCLILAELLCSWSNFIVIPI